MAALQVPAFLEPRIQACRHGPWSSKPDDLAHGPVGFFQQNLPAASLYVLCSLSENCRHLAGRDPEDIRGPLSGYPRSAPGSTPSPRAPGPGVGGVAASTLGHGLPAGPVPAARPGGVLKGKLLRFGGASAGSSGCGGSSAESTRNRSPWSSTNQPLRPCRCRLKALDSSASHSGRSRAISPQVGIQVKSWRAQTVLQEF